ncbi:type III-B CRISPR-associated protein Cas10/Cmr2 [Ignicoccus hospitalis]|uniref:CRISPR-associated protein Cmr2 N-terminal domain-containing protein n=1 Tax=Ignicoccus hospitalis (strain KIN4/I / DSM 18386 / JCM 14125) TaxID=453591 RepID=A8A9P4_IGNH4|nr:type III-B CRISPR-associated protein Cas10/Cmr2 [Ignicoccus hospitalis]ABU81646.1 hypothetical protein Igni_0463 [Ignicoccus hospitalis KIN4/I]HIH89763.1 hypothetical protein [Desulfurococcaceae archaeon]
MSCEELFARKAAALLHDPPEKVWASFYKHESHEKRAKDAAKEFFGEGFVKTLDEVKEHDRLASTVDRWTAVGTEVRGRLNEVSLVNPFDPEFSYKVKMPKIKDDAIARYRITLKSILEKVEDSSKGVTRKKYHALYAFMEPAWYVEVGQPLPADSRFPTHTIFDHVYATAMMVNIYDPKKNFDGFFVEVEIPEARSFLKGGRGPGDWWARGWLLSNITWRLVEELVWEVGPDILLFPTARYNPFYYSLIQEKIPELKEEYERYLKPLGSVKNPVVPPAVSLFLPRCAIELMKSYLEDKHPKDLKLDSTKIIKMYFETRLREAWEDFVKKLLEGLNSVGEAGLEGLRTFGAEGELGAVLERVEDKPPFEVRVTVIDLRKALTEFNKVLKERSLIRGVKDELRELLAKKYRVRVGPGEDLVKVIKGKVSDKVLPYTRNENDLERDLERKLFFHWLVTSKHEAVKGAEDVGVDPRLVDGWSLEEGKRTYESCVRNRPLCACGRPAAVHNPTDKDTKFVRAHEALCPYCLALRLAQHVPLAEGLRAPRALTSTLAAAPELACWLIEKGKASAKGARGRELVWTLARALLEPPPGATRLNLEALPEELEEKGELVAGLEGFVIRITKEDLRAINSMNKYLAVIKSTVDRLDDLKKGRLPYGTEEYFREAVKKGTGSEGGKDLELAIDIIKIVVDFARGLAPQRAGGGEAGQTVLVTPTYLSQLSYSLMTQALVDAKLIELNFGLPALASGGELVALVPARTRCGPKGLPEELGKLLKDETLLKRVKEDYYSPALWAWWLTRLNHWGLLGEPKGFRRSELFFAPALLAYGRRYGIAIRHFKDPLAKVYEEAEGLEAPLRSTGDWTGVSYGRLGAEGVASPNSLGASRKEEVAERGLGPTTASLAFLNYKGLSNNYYYDLISFVGKYASAGGSSEALEALIEYVLKRNVVSGGEGAAKEALGRLKRALGAGAEGLEHLLEFGFHWHKAAR